MTASVHVGGATKTMPAISFRDVSGTLLAVAVGYVRDAANVLKLFTSSLSVSLSTDDVGGHVNSGLSVAIQSQPVTVTAAGGSGAYSYLWTRTDAAPGTWSINAPTSDTTTFTGGNCGPDESLSATFHCTVTDGAGNVVVTGNVSVTVSNIGFNISGGGGPLP